MTKSHRFILFLVLSSMPIGILHAATFHYAGESYCQVTPALEPTDSSESAVRRSKYTPLHDSLRKVLDANPSDIEARLAIANILYDMQIWDEAKQEYELYLAVRPADVNARVDYAFIVAQLTHDYKRAIEEVKKGLAIDPEHVKGLFNAGIYAFQAYNSKEEKVLEAEYYFKHAKAAAIKQHEVELFPKIEQVIKELEQYKNDNDPIDK